MLSSYMRYFFSFGMTQIALDDTTAQLTSFSNQFQVLQDISACEVLHLSYSKEIYEGCTTDCSVVYGFSLNACLIDSFAHDFIIQQINRMSYPRPLY
jgi:hypothetical protein